MEIYPFYPSHVFPFSGKGRKGKGNHINRFFFVPHSEITLSELSINPQILRCKVSGYVQKIPVYRREMNT